MDKPLEASEFKKLTPTERDWHVYDVLVSTAHSPGSCHPAQVISDHENRLQILEDVKVEANQKAERRTRILLAIIGLFAGTGGGLAGAIIVAIITGGT